jgi:hypothetical protein
MQVCNTTWAKNMTTGSPALEALVAKINAMEAKVNTMEAKGNIMGDIITSMIMVLEDTMNKQMRLNLTVDRLASAGSQTSTQVNPPTFPPGSTPPATPTTACTIWNKTEAHHSLVFFTVKKLDGSSAPCSDAIADAFIAQVPAAAAVRRAAAPAAADSPAGALSFQPPAPWLFCLCVAGSSSAVGSLLTYHNHYASHASQLKADYTDNIEECTGDGELVIGMNLHSATPKRGSDFGCVSSSSSASPSAGAMYFAVVTAYSHFPCAQQAVSLRGWASATDRRARVHAGFAGSVSLSGAPGWRAPRPLCGSAAAAHQPIHVCGSLPTGRQHL